MSKTLNMEQLFNTMMQFVKFMSHYSQESHEERLATMLQFSALSFLKDQPNGTVGELAKFMQLSKSSATQLIERLVNAELVERIHDQEDRRIIRLFITPKGKEEFITLRKNIMEKMNKFVSKIPAKDISELIRIHTNLIETLKKEQNG